MALSPSSRGTPAGAVARPSREGRQARREAAAVDRLAGLYRDSSNLRQVQLAVGDDPDLARVALELERSQPKPRSSLVDWLTKRAT